MTTKKQFIGRHQELEFVENVVESSIEEIEVVERGLMGKAKVGFKYIGSKFHKSYDKIDSIYLKYHESGRRKFYWTIWEKRQGNFCNYQEFKEWWDPNTKVWKEIKSKMKVNISSKVERVIRTKDPFGTGSSKPIDSTTIRRVGRS